MDTYSKAEYDIPMRDGVKLHTVVYTPKNVPGTHPILMERTPYGAGPYGPDRYKGFPRQPQASGGGLHLRLPGRSGQEPERG